MSDILLIGSCEPFSGKSALVLGIAKKFYMREKKYVLVNPWQHVSNLLIYLQCLMKD